MGYCFGDRWAASRRITVRSIISRKNIIRVQADFGGRPAGAACRLFNNPELRYGPRHPPLAPGASPFTLQKHCWRKARHRNSSRMAHSLHSVVPLRAHMTWRRSISRERSKTPPPSKYAHTTIAPKVMLWCGVTLLASLKTFAAAQWVFRSASISACIRSICLFSFCNSFKSNGARV